VTDIGGDLSLGDGFCQPFSDTVVPEGSGALSSKKPTMGAVRLSFAFSGGAPMPTFQPICLAPASKRFRRSAICARIPLAMRGSFNVALMAAAFAGEKISRHNAMARQHYRQRSG
jgi:hypothetical protein